ncbi:recombinase RecJ [Halobacteriales archaeon QH_10_67_13]|nr:MAG: recombinase RecJ [Halobacteriales archaeon QH_10_67_13]
MATAGRSETDTSPNVAARLREAGFVRLAAAPTGDAVGAAALLARGLAAAGTPYQLSIAPPSTAERATDADLTVGLGHAAGEPAIALDGAGPVSRRAAAIAETLGESDPVLAAAGMIAAGETPEGTVVAPGEESGPSLGESRPGVGTPPVSPADGLAHSTLVHAFFSGRPERAAELHADADEPAEDSTAGGETVASLVALTVAEEAETPTAAEAIERFLSPRSGGPLGTVAGLADALDALAEPSPGLAAGLALGYSDRERIIEAWRTAARAVHEAVRTAELSRYDGLVVAELETSAPLAPTTRLLREYRSPEPVVAVLDESTATAATPPKSGPDLAAATQSIDGAAGTPDRVRLDDPGAAEELVAGLQEVA